MGILSTLTGGSKSSSASGFAAFPKEIQDYMLENLFPKIQQYAETPYQGIPLRRTNASDNDPIFGSKGLQAIQEYKDAIAAMQAANPATAEAEDVETEDGDPYNKYTMPQAYMNTFVPQGMWSDFEKPSVKKKTIDDLLAAGGNTAVLEATGRYKPKSGQAAAILDAIQKRPVQAMDAIGYDAFSQKRAAQGLPPITPTDWTKYVAGGQ